MTSLDLQDLPDIPQGLARLELLDAAIEDTAHSVLITDADLDDGPHIVYVNRGFEQMTGYYRDEVLGLTPRILQGPKTSRAVLDDLRATLERGEGFDAETINYRKDGEPYSVHWHISPVRARGEHESITHFVSVQRDVTEDRRREEQLRLLSAALEASGDPVLITDPEGVIVFANTAFIELSGFDAERVIGATPALFKSEEHDDEFFTTMWERLRRGEAFRGEFVNRRPDGEKVHLEQTITPVRDDCGEITHFVAFGKDVTERVHMEGEIRRLAETDWLTGLANRLTLGNRLEAEMDRCERYQRPMAVIMFDIDHFKAVNDEHGHEAGDVVLKAVARTVDAQLREQDLLGRWGGEEFLIVLPETDGEGAAVAAEKLRRSIAQLDLPDAPAVTASFGVTERQPDDTPRAITRRVDQAMYQAKEGGRDRVVLL
ncbi:diguanylate cyclase [Thioalkalivibrio sp. ALE23]|uniref:sensor domain-containing diguanylate cyclase n=1 Tax=Thioalkalivibrio sp. ALE23 TaxID=1265495 RepID=UPI000371CBFA|nr:diguanylate cyclase [Thioalkalivibrio sp. ALE23]